MDLFIKGTIASGIFLPFVDNLKFAAETSVTSYKSMEKWMGNLKSHNKESAIAKGDKVARFGRGWPNVLG